MRPNSKRNLILKNKINLLDGEKETKSEMTSANLNQFMKTKINLNPQVLSKNTSEIVSTCIEKLYKQVPNKFKNGLQQIKIAAARKENQAPLRSFKAAQENMRQRENIVDVQSRVKKRSPSNIDEALLLRTVMNASRKRLLGNSPEVHKKLLKPPTYKIYSARRFGSSASSSSGSLFRRRDCAKRQLSAHALRQLKKSYTMIHGAAKKSSFVVQPKVVRSVAKSLRHQHMYSGPGSATQALQVNSSIQRDLMAIDKILKNRKRHDEDSKKGRTYYPGTVWDYPPTPQHSQCRNEQLAAISILQEQQSKLLQMVMRRQTAKEALKPSSTPPPPAPKKRDPLKRQRYANPIVIGRETLRPATISPNERRVYIKRKPLSELQRPQVPEFTHCTEQLLTLPPTLTMEKDIDLLGPAKLQKPYKTNGRIAPTSTATLAHSAMLNRERYNRINYAKLSANLP